MLSRFIFSFIFRYNYKLIREYTWSVKKNTDLEENCNFIFRDDGVYYNTLATRVRLNKRRAKGGKISNIRLAVKYRNYTRDELKQQVIHFIYHLIDFFLIVYLNRNLDVKILSR